MYDKVMKDGKQTMMLKKEFGGPMEMSHMKMKSPMDKSPMDKSPMDKSPMDKSPMDKSPMDDAHDRAVKGRGPNRAFIKKDSAMDMSHMKLKKDSAMDMSHMKLKEDSAMDMSHMKLTQDAAMKLTSALKKKMRMVKGPGGDMVPDFAVDGKGANDLKK